MRTTLDLDEGVLRVVKQLAAERQQSLGRVLSDIVRNSLRTPERMPVEHGRIPVLPRRPGAQTVTSDNVKHLLELEPSA